MRELISHVRMDDLVGQHGVSIEATRPWLDPLEDMNELILPGNSKFAAVRNEANPDVLDISVRLPENGPNYRVDYNGYNKAMRLVGFSESVISKYPIQMMIEPLNWGFENKIGDSLKAFIKDDNIVAFVKPTLELVSTRRLVETAFDICGESALCERLDHNLQFTNVNIIVGNRAAKWTTKKLPSGDVILGGVNFQNSIMGESPLEVSTYIYRLVCSNGLISAESMFKWSRKTEATPLIEWFTEKIRSAYEFVDHEFDKVDQMISMDVPEHHRAEIVANVFSKYELSERMRQSVLSRLVDDPPDNMWDITNSITAEANAEEYQDSPHTVRRLQRIGGDITTKAHVCPTCFAVTRN